MNAEILCVGTELLLGDIVNTNAAFLAKELAAMGIAVYHQSVVGDNGERLAESFRLALSRADIVITSGGLGPTYDDLTKETAAACFGRPMLMDEEALREIEEIFQKIGREMTENNKKQAMMPEGAVVFHNRNGTAPGLALENEGKIIIMLPGPPRELKPMFFSSVQPYLRGKSQQVLLSRNVHIFGLGESAVEDLLKEKMEAWTNPTVAPYAKEGEVLLRVTASAASAEEADVRIEPVLEELTGLLGDNVYGIDVGSLQNALVQKLIQKKRRVAVAESCTGGLVAERITQIPGASQVFDCGVCSYANEIKNRVLGVKKETLEQYGAVSPETAAEMAAGIRALAGADIGISTTGIAGPGGGTEKKPVGLVYVGVSSEKYTEVIQLQLSRGYEEERNYIRYVASSHALNLGLKAADLV